MAEEIDAGDDTTHHLPESVVETAETLTRRARRAVDPGEAATYRREREETLATHGYTARVREDDTRDVLVLHPASWVDDGRIRTDRIDDLDRGIEVPLSGPGAEADWETVAAHNREIAEQVAEAHGAVHGETAHALADFVSNHYAKPIEDATPDELREFREEYLVRNAWPSDEQLAVVETSIEVTVAAADAAAPLVESD